LTRRASRIHNARMQGLRLLGAVGGAAFAVLMLATVAIASGPSSASGVTVVEYYSVHGTVTLWQAALAGLAFVCFVWFTGTFVGWMSNGPAVVASAAAMAALYLAAIGCWESLGENYAGVEITSVSSEGYGDAHVLYDIGVGALHLANFMDAAFVGATAAALLTAAAPWPRLGRIGLGLTIVHLINAPLQIFATSDWSDAVGAIVFLALLAWVFGLSVVLFVSMRRAATLVQTQTARV
jgi:hypothetical protein